MELTITDIKELLYGNCIDIGTGSLKVGEVYVIRTVTYHYIGRLKTATNVDIVLSDACWLADSGRWNNALVNGSLNEVEPFPNDVIIRLAVIVDATQWCHPLPKDVK